MDRESCRKRCLNAAQKLKAQRAERERNYRDQRQTVSNNDNVDDYDKGNGKWFVDENEREESGVEKRNKCRRIEIEKDWSEGVANRGEKERP